MPFRPSVAVMGKGDMAFEPFQAPAAQSGADIHMPARLERDLTQRTDPDRAAGVAKYEAVNSLIHNRS